MASPVPIAVFAKPPRAGEVKTRLRLETGRAALLAEAMLQDTWALAASRPWGRPVLAATEALSAYPLPKDAAAWQQGGGDLGARVERILRRGLAEGGQVLGLGSDSPHLTAAMLDAAHAALRHADAVLGPTEDGGFWVIGVRALPKDALAGLPWSAPETFEATWARLASLGLEVAQVEGTFDVDAPEDLVRLQALLEHDPARAPHTAALLAGR